MSDVTSQDLNRLSDAIESMVGAQAKLARNMGSNRSGSSASSSDDAKRKKRSMEIATQLQGMSGHLRKVDKEMGHFADGLGDSVKALKATIGGLTSLTGAVGAVVVVTGLVAGAIGDTIKHYQEMTAVGQTFGGSMLKMQLAAADAALPLDEFAEAVRKNSQVIAGTGSKAFFDLNKSVRASLKDFGMLGMTVQQITDFQSEYLETQRMYGNLQNLDVNRASSSMQNLAIETTKLAQLTGKNRADIMKDAQQALRDNSLASLMLQSTAESAAALGESTQKAVTYLAALPGEGSKIMASMLTQTVGKGAVQLTDQYQMFVNGGLDQVGNMMESLAAKVKTGKIKDGDLEKFRDDFVKESMANMDALKYNADMGNEDAKRIIQITSEWKNLSGKQLSELSKMTKVTSFMTTLEERFKELSGSIRSKLFSSLEAAWNGFDSFGKKSNMKALSERFSDLGKNLMDMVNKYLTPEFFNKAGNVLAEGLEMFAGFMLDTGKFVVDNWQKIQPIFTTAGEGLKMLGGIAVSVGGWVAANSDKIKSVFTFVTDVISAAFSGIKLLTDKFGVLATTVGLVVATMAASKIKDKLTERFTIGHGGLNELRRFATRDNALRVFVVNGGAGADTSDGPGNDRNRRRRGGRRPRPGSPRARPAGLGSKIWSGAKNIASKAPGLVKGGAGLLKGGLKIGGGAIAATAANYAIDNLMDEGSLKDSLKMLSSVAGGAATGAMLGSIVPGIGNVIGGVLGGLVGGVTELWSNWDTISSNAKANLDKTGKALSNAVTSTTQTVSKVAAGAMNVFSSAITGAKNIVGNIMSSIGNGFTSLFSWATDLLSPKNGSSPIATIMSMFPLGSVALQAINALTGQSGGQAAPISGPANQKNQEPVKVNTEQLEQQVKALQAQNVEIAKENAELRRTMNRLMDVLVDNNGVLKAGLTEQIQEIRKGNRSIKNLGDSF